MTAPTAPASKLTRATGLLAGMDSLLEFAFTPSDGRIVSEPPRCIPSSLAQTGEEMEEKEHVNKISRSADFHYQTVFCSLFGDVAAAEDAFDVDAVRAFSLSQHLGEVAQPLKPNQLVLEPRITRVQPTRIRQYKYSRTMYFLLLRARTLALRNMKKSAVDAHAHERNHARLYSSNLSREYSSPLYHLRRAQLGCRTRRPRTQIRQRQVEFHQPRVVFTGEHLRYQPRRMKQPPERIARARKMMPHLLGAKTWIDPDEQNPRPRFQDVAQFCH